MNAIPTIAGARRPTAADLWAVIRRITAAAAREIRIRREINYLMEQSDHMLLDVGISRAEVMHAVHGRYC